MTFGTFLVQRARNAFKTSQTKLLRSTGGGGHSLILHELHELV